MWLSEVGFCIFPPELSGGGSPKPHRGRPVNPSNENQSRIKRSRNRKHSDPWGSLGASVAQSHHELHPCQNSPRRTLSRWPWVRGRRGGASQWPTQPPGLRTGLSPHPGAAAGPGGWPVGGIFRKHCLGSRLTAGEAEGTWSGPFRCSWGSRPSSSWGPSTGVRRLPLQLGQGAPAALAAAGRGAEQG